MDRKDFLIKGAGLLLLSGFSIKALSLAPVIYTVKTKRCDGCGHCFKACHHNALYVKEGKAYIDSQHCKGCGDCLRFCKRMAIVPKEENQK